MILGLLNSQNIPAPMGWVELEFQLTLSAGICEPGATAPTIVKPRRTESGPSALWK
jgi:hypothetical protein